MDLLYMIIAFVLGVAVSFLWLRIRLGNTYRGKLDVLKKEQHEECTERKLAEQTRDNLSKEHDRLKEKYEAISGELQESRQELGVRVAEMNALKERLEEQKKNLEGMEKEMGLHFENLANKILEKQSEKFDNLNKERMGELINPLREQIKDFNERIHNTHKDNIEERTSLKEQIKQLSQMNEHIQKEARNLTNALKGESKTQGNWGEIMLVQILEKSGLKGGEEYHVQESFTTESGNRLQPDVIVDFPDNKHVIIDSKVSLTAYERYVNATDEDSRKEALKEHLESVKRHIDSLAKKDYTRVYDMESLDFVMMFMPVEPAYMLAMQQDPQLWQYAYDKRLVLVSPTHLFSSLRMIAGIWRQDKYNRHAQVIAEESGKLLDKFNGFLNDMRELGKRLNKVNDSYNSALKKLKDGSGNLVKKAGDIKELGVKTKKEMSEADLPKEIQKD